MRITPQTAGWRTLAALAVALGGCGVAQIQNLQLDPTADGGIAGDTTAGDGTSGAPGAGPSQVSYAPGADPGLVGSLPSRTPVGPTQADADAGTAPPPEVADAGAQAPGEPDAGASSEPTPPPAAPANPSFGSWAWGAPDVTAVAHAGFDWFESGYPGTVSASDNAYLAQHGTVPFAYINMSEVPNTDSYLQGQIGSFWSSIALCQNTSWNTTVVDVRDPRWQDWLERRANAAYALGNRGIKWDVAGVESLCGGWSGQPGAPQQAIDAMASVLAALKAQHPDFKFIVNQGFGLAEQHPELVDGFELENMINYADANPSDAWATETIAEVGSIHAKGIPIFDLEYYDLFGCSDTTCGQADQIYDQAIGLGWVPYITVVDMNVQGRGLGITPPW